MTTTCNKRKIAKAAGVETYETGKPCKYGHFSPRLTKTSGCMECISNTKAEYKNRTPEQKAIAAAHSRKYRADNREQSRAYMNAYMKDYAKKRRAELHNLREALEASKLESV